MRRKWLTNNQKFKKVVIIQIHGQREYSADMPFMSLCGATVNTKLGSVCFTHWNCFEMWAQAAHLKHSEFPLWVQYRAHWVLT